MNNNTKIDELYNFGPKTKGWLAELNIYTLEQLRQWEYIDVYKALHIKGYPANRLFLYAMWGALHNTHWRDVPQNVKDDFAKQIKNTKL